MQKYGWLNKNIIVQKITVSFNGYFFALMNKAKIHPIKDHPNISDPIRTRIWSYFELLFTDAKYTGVKIMPTNIMTSTTYFNPNKTSFNVII